MRESLGRLWRKNHIPRASDVDPAVGRNRARCAALLAHFVRIGLMRRGVKGESSMKRVLVLAAAAAVATAFASTAGAADIRRAPPPVAKAPAYVAPIFTWTGFYIGGNLGYGWGDGSGTVTNTGIAPLGATGPVSGNGNGILGGVQIGYNWQTGAFVWGVETDFQLSAGEGTFAGNTGAVTFTGNSKNEWFGTIRGRLGYAVDRWLLYVTGGGAYSHNSISGTDSLARTFNASATGWSWTVGGGVEAALTNNWSVKGEYLYISTPDTLPIRAGTTITGDTDSHVFRVGVNYRF